MTTIGEKLKEARKKNGMTIDELQQKTKIQKKYLEALEEDNYQEMPGTFYVRAFIRQYAEAVGLDGEALVANFDGKSNNIDDLGVQGDNQVSGSRKSMHDENNKSALKGKIPLLVLTALAVVIVTVVVVITIQDNKQNKIIDQSQNVEIENKAASKEQSDAKANKAKADKAAKEQAEQEKATKEQAEAEKAKQEKEKKEKTKISFQSEAGSEVNMAVTNAKSPIKIGLEGVTAPCWVGVLANGTFIYEKTVQPGEVAEAELPDQLAEVTLVLGASDNIKVTLNEKEVKFNPNNTGNIKKNVHLSLEYKQ